MRIFLTLLALALAFGGLSACGVRGDLTRPEAGKSQ